MNVDKIIDCLILYNDQVESEMSIAKEIADYLNTTYGFIYPIITYRRWADI